MKDYLGNEICIGDKIIYSDNGRGTFSTATITGYKRRKCDNKDEYIDYVVFNDWGSKGWRESYWIISLTALERIKNNKETL